VTFNAKLMPNQNLTSENYRCPMYKVLQLLNTRIYSDIEIKKNEICCLSVS